MFPGIDIVGAVVATVAGLIWFLRLEGRVNSHDLLFEERGKQVLEWMDTHEKRDNERHLELKAGIAEIKECLKEAPQAIQMAQVVASAKLSADAVIAAAKLLADAATTAQTAPKPTRKPRSQK